METAKLFLFAGSVSGFLSVALGAFGAHALKSRIDEYHLGVFQTGVQYQFYHALALVLLGALALRLSHPLVRYAGWSFLVGTLVFSGSLYALALTKVRMLGAITPLGGLGFLLGWALLAVATLKVE